MPLGDGPRNHPLLKDLNLGPLGNGSRGSPLVTSTLLFVSQAGGGLGRGEALKVGGRELTPQTPEPPKFRAFDKSNGELVWEYELPVGPAALMTYRARRVRRPGDWRWTRRGTDRVALRGERSGVPGSGVCGRRAARPLEIEPQNLRTSEPQNLRTV